jgi:CBS-domain-containing membrane protein
LPVIIVSALKNSCYVLILNFVQGAFVAMAMLGRLDQMVASKGLSFTIAPLGAVSAVLFGTPTAPGARVGSTLSHNTRHLLIKASLPVLS